MNLFQDKINQLVQELRKSESGLELSEERVRTLVKVIPAGLLIIDAKGNIEAANREAEKIFALTAGSLAGQDFNNLLHSKEKNKKALDLHTLCKLNDPTEFIAIRQNGATVPVQIQIREFSTFTDQQFLIVVEDVTKRFEIEQMKADFIAMVSHDLRSPLTSISTFHELVASGIYDNNPDLLKQKIKRTQLELKRLINMINGLLDLEKIESGHFDMLISSVDCKTLIELSINSVEALAQYRQIQISSFLPEVDYHVNADEKYILQVLVNLLSNALKFSLSGRKVEVRVECVNSVDSEETQQIKFLVIDEGPGIKEEFKERMFNKFEQAHISDSRVKGGSGLGLAFSKKIVEQHGGKIGVDSKEGIGSTFWFTLPLSVSSPDQHERLPEMSVPSELTLKKIYLEKVIESALEAVELFTEELGIALEASGTDAIIQADSDLLMKSLVSIITVLAKDAGKKSTVIVEASKSEREVQLKIFRSSASDAHPQQSLDENAFEDKAKTELSFCKKIIEMHNGTIQILRNSQQEISIILSLPLLEP